MSRRGAARSWWGQAWIDAIEQQANGGPNRVPQGRSDVRAGKVSPITIEPGMASAEVTGNRFEPYRVEVTVRSFTDDEWETLLEVLSAKVDHTAALIDGELDPNLVEEAAAAEVNLLPRSGEIDVRCSCADRAAPCKHATAVCTRLADELDADPFALLELRGRSRDEILAAVRRRRAEAASTDGNATTITTTTTMPAPADSPRTPVDEGVDAADAWNRRRAPLPHPPPLRYEPARPPTYSVHPPSDATFDAGGLQSLIADASRRAWQALAEGSSLGLDTGFDDDVVRRSVTARHDEGFGDVASRLGTSAAALARKAAAWEVAGEAGVAIANEEAWPADPLVMSAARLAVEEVLRGHIRGDIDGNHLTLGDLQLRLSQAGEWWSFQREGDVWLLADGPVNAADELVEPRPGRRR